MAKNTSLRGTAWLVAAFVGILLIVAGCTCARQADTDNTTVSQAQPDTAPPPPLVNPADDLPADGEGNDQAAVSAAAGQEENGAEAENGEEAGDDAADEDEGTDDPVEDEGDDETGDNGNGDGGAGDEPVDNGQGDNPDGGDEAAEPDTQIDAATLFRRAYCGDCHGAERKGTSRGPSLGEIDQYWNAVDLAEYFKSPNYVAEGNTRLIELGRQYRMMMPPVHMDEDELLALASWLIEQAAAEE